MATSLKKLGYQLCKRQGEMERTCTYLLSTFSWKVGFQEEKCAKTKQKYWKDHCDICGFKYTFCSCDRSVTLCNTALLSQTKGMLAHLPQKLISHCKKECTYFVQKIVSEFFFFVTIYSVMSLFSPICSVVYIFDFIDEFSFFHHLQCFGHFVC